MVLTKQQSLCVYEQNPLMTSEYHQRTKVIKISETSEKN